MKKPVPKLNPKERAAFINTKAKRTHNNPPEPIDMEEVLGKTDPTDSQIKTISGFVRQQMDLSSQLADVQALASKLSQEIHQLNTKEIPDALAAAGVSEIKMPDGTRVSVEDALYGSLPKEEAERNEAIRWLTSVGAADIVKAEISLAFAKGQAKELEKVRKALIKLNVVFDVKEGVHASTLQAFARERLKNGEAVPFTTLGLFPQRMAKIKPPKKGK